MNRTVLTKEEYRKALSELMKRKNAFDYRMPGYDALLAEERAIVIGAVKHYGVTNPDAPDCDDCRKVSVFGGPHHKPSIYCKSYGYPHCTCEACF